MDDEREVTAAGQSSQVDWLDWLEQDPWLGRKVQFRTLLGALGKHDHIVIQLGEDDDNTYQQARWIEHTLVVEAVSNEFLPEHHQLDDHQELVMLGLGWQPTTEEFPNFHRCYELPIALTAVAETMVATFAAVYSASPCDTFYVAPAHFAQLL